MLVFDFHFFIDCKRRTEIVEEPKNLLGKMRGKYYEIINL